MRTPFVPQAVAVLLTSLLLCHCAGRTTDDAEKKALQRRVAELEARLQPSATPLGPSPSATPMPPPTPDPTTRQPRAQAPSRLQTPAAQPAIGDVPSPAGSLAPPPPERVALLDDDLLPEEAPPSSERWSIPDGAQLELIIETPLSSRSSVVGDDAVARLEQVSDADGPLPLPGGSVIEGRVTRVKSAGRLGSRALLAVVFDRITVRGQPQPLEPIVVTIEGRSDLDRDGSLVAGGAVAGAVVGRLLGGRDGARRGATLGGIGGAGAAAATKAADLELASGDRWSVTVTRVRHGRRD